MVEGYITKIQRFSIHDGPGIRTTIFTKGCSLECMWCQNPETIRRRPEITFDVNKCVSCGECIKVCPQNCFSQHEGKLHFNSSSCDQCGKCVPACPVQALKWTAEKWSTDAILERILQDKEYYDLSGGGLTLSGGEPLFQINFAADLAAKAKAHNLHVTFDTAAHVPYTSFEKVLPYADLFLFDLKFIDNDLHKKYIGKANTHILENFRRLCETDKRIIVRIPMIPDVTDTEENLAAIESFSRSCRQDIEINQIPFNAFMPEKYEMIGQPSYLDRQKNPAQPDLAALTIALPLSFNRAQ